MSRTDLQNSSSTDSMLKQPDFDTLRKKKFTYRLFGVGISHSKAPLMHNFLFGKLGIEHFNYEIMDSPDVELYLQYTGANKDATCEDELIYNGSAVTMPHKVTMTKHVDLIDDNAKAVGAINTIYVRFRDGKPITIGTNTDTIGIRDLLKFNAPATVEKNLQSKKPGLVYGGGGACRSAIYALYEYLGCSKIYVVNRFPEEVQAIAEDMKANGFAGEIVPVETPEQAEKLEKPELVVLTVPDFEAVTEQEKLARATLEVFIQSKDKGAVLEMCYHPQEITRLYTAFENAGWKVVGGVEAMIYQGLAQQVLWTGYELDEMPVKEVVEHVSKNVHQ